MSNTPANSLTIEQRVEQYVKLRDMIKEMDDAHKAAVKPYKEALDGLNNIMMTMLQGLGVDSAKTGAGTVYQKTRTTASIADGEAFMAFVIEHQAFDLLDRKANATAVQAFAEENNSLPPGINLNRMVDVGVRRS